VFGCLSVWAAAIALLGCTPQQPPDAFETPARNVILISLDTLRADHLSLYGYPRPTSPEIDAFARHAFIFDRTLAPAPNTPPSQMTMMTSLTPGRHGFTGHGDALAPGIETLAERLSQADLQTAGFVDGGYLRAVFGFDRGFGHYEDFGGGLATILPRALAWLDAHRDERSFLFLHSYDIHAPYVAPAPFYGMFHEVPNDSDIVQDPGALWLNHVELTDEDMQHLVDSYDEGIRYADAQVGAFVRALEERGRLEDTLIILTSDHGEEFGEHGSLVHWRLYFQPNLRIPLVIRPPGGLDAPVRLSDTAQLLDILPTVLDATGAPPLRQSQGESLLPVMRARAAGQPVVRPAAPLERAVLGWWPDHDRHPGRSIVLDNYQLLFDVDDPGEVELFDIEEDPMTQSNLALERPAEVARLLALAREGLAGNQELLSGGEPEALQLDRAVLEQLEALGYATDDGLAGSRRRSEGRGATR